MWKNNKISIIFPTYNEEKNIKNAVEDFFDTGVVDEVIVVNNNSTDDTVNEAKKTDARIINETKQGYGNALQRGFNEATGDYIFMCEPDGTFNAKDIFKFLAYAEEFDTVFGTRTSKSCIGNKANMGWYLRYGNIVVAKLLEYVHNGPCLTDVGCTFKLIKKPALERIKGEFSVGKNHFAPEFMILCLKNKLKTIEIPINYGERIGESKITGKFSKALKLAIIIILFIIGFKFGLAGKSAKKISSSDSNSNK